MHVTRLFIMEAPELYDRSTFCGSKVWNRRYPKEEIFFINKVGQSMKMLCVVDVVYCGNSLFSSFAFLNLK